MALMSSMEPECTLVGWKVPVFKEICRIWMTRNTCRIHTDKRALKEGFVRLLQMSIQCKYRFLKATLRYESVTIGLSCGHNGEGNTPQNLSSSRVDLACYPPPAR